MAPHALGHDTQVNVAKGKKMAAVLASEAEMQERINRGLGEASAIEAKAGADAAAIKLLAAAHRVQSPPGHARPHLATPDAVRLCGPHSRGSQDPWSRRRRSYLAGREQLLGNAVGSCICGPALSGWQLFSNLLIGASRWPSVAMRGKAR